VLAFVQRPHTLRPEIVALCARLHHARPIQRWSLVLVSPLEFLPSRVKTRYSPWVPTHTARDAEVMARAERLRAKIRDAIVKAKELVAHSTELQTRAEALLTRRNQPPSDAKSRH
jgi:hypothetical protein